MQHYECLMSTYDVIQAKVSHRVLCFLCLDFPSLFTKVPREALSPQKLIDQCFVINGSHYECFHLPVFSMFLLLGKPEAV